MDPFQSSSEDGHPPLKTAGSVSAVSAEGYATVEMHHFEWMPYLSRAQKSPPFCVTPPVIVGESIYHVAPGRGEVLCNGASAALRCSAHPHASVMTRLVP